MKIKTLIGLNSIAAVLAACGGGDIKLNPSNTVTDSNNTIIDGGGSTNPGTTNPCATYTDNGQTYQGSYAEGNCTYPVTFVSDTRPMTVDLVIPELADNGIHIFQDSLFVGEDVTSGTAPKAGEGPTLVIAPGAKIAFSGAQDYLRIARGSRIEAEGTVDKPIIISSVTDLRDGTATEADRGLWGGVQINGNGLTNKCTDEPSGTYITPCNVTAEGRPATYGGTDNTENSGTLRYVVIKHAGYEVVDGSELNGLTLNAVGSGTTIEYVQVYTTQDDGFEMFGGAVNLKNVIGVNIGDDTFDFSEGWTGNIQFALSVANSGSNNCVEADNTGSNRADHLEPLTKGRISNLTCVTSGVDENQGDFPSSKGDSEGMVYREGAIFELYNSIVTSNTPDMSSNECFEIADTDGPETIAYAQAGYSVAKSNFVACANEVLKVAPHATNAGFDFTAWLNNGTNTDNVIVDDSVTGALPVTILEGLATNPRAYITAASFADGNTTPISIPVFDVTQLQDTFAADAVPALGAAGNSSFFEAVDFIGAVSAANDWTTGWTVGLAE